MKFSIDKYTLRGIIYIIISLVGIGYEVFSSSSIRLILIILYTCVIGIGLICIFVVKEHKED